MEWEKRVCVGRERERDRDRDRERETETETERERQRERETETERQRDRETERQRRIPPPFSVLEYESQREANDPFHTIDREGDVKEGVEPDALLHNGAAACGDVSRRMKMVSFYINR